MKKGFGLVGILIVVGVIAVLFGGGYYYTQPDKVMPEENEEEISDESDFEEVEVFVNEEKLNNNFDDNEAVDWEIYRNEEYGFEIQYPIEVQYNVVNDELVNFYYDVDKMKEILNTGKVDNRILAILVEENEEHLDLTSWVNKWVVGTWGNLAILNNIKELSLNNGMKTVEYTDNAGHLWVSIQNSDLIYIFSYANYSYSEDSKKMFSIINEIISTFKFIE